MNYGKHYELLIARARNRILFGYTEQHHVVPRCLGGKDRPDNLVVLTPEEHYVAHLLLLKMYPHEKGLMWAAVVMTGAAKHQPRRNKIYGWLRRRVSEYMTGKPVSEKTRSILAAANKGKRFSPERCAAISAGKTGRKTGPCSDHRRRNIAIANTGKTASSGTRAKMRAAKLGRKQTFEHAANAAKARVGRLVSEETRAKIRASMLGKNVGKRPSKKVRTQMSASIKACWERRKEAVL